MYFDNNHAFRRILLLKIRITLNICMSVCGTVAVSLYRLLQLLKITFKVAVVNCCFCCFCCFYCLLVPFVCFIHYSITRIVHLVYQCWFVVWQHDNYKILDSTDGSLGRTSRFINIVYPQYSLFVVRINEWKCPSDETAKNCKKEAKKLRLRSVPSQGP